MRIVVEQAARVTDASLIADAGEKTFCGATTDSRKVKGGELFVALRGPRNDGHNFVGQAFARGAAAAVVERWPIEGLPERVNRPVLRVQSSLHALGELARFARQKLKARVAAITGTAGKTGTKEMAATICRTAVGKVLSGPVAATESSQNNLVGLPLTLLNLEGDEEVVVLEMGMNALGEIARLTAIADPDVGLITNIGLAHLRPSPGSISLNSAPRPVLSLEGVAQAKGELWREMKPQGVAVVNLDDPKVVRLARQRGGKQVRFSLDFANRQAEVRCGGVRELGLDGQEFELVVGTEKVRVRLTLPGTHQRANAVASAALCHALGIPAAIIAEGLGAFRPLSMRGEMVRLGHDIIVINDAYNANPLSMAASLRTLASLPASRRIAVLGDMRELGEMSQSAHQEIGRLVAELGIDFLLGVGEFAEQLAQGARNAGMDEAKVVVFASVGELTPYLATQLREGDRVLLKASRAVGLEVVLEELKKTYL